MKLSELRKTHKLSQKALAEKIGYSQNMISQWENGTRDPNTKTLQTLANFFNVSVDYLLDNEEATPKTKKIPKDLKKILEDEEVTLNGRLVTEEDKEKMMRILEAAFYEAKEMNRRK